LPIWTDLPQKEQQRPDPQGCSGSKEAIKTPPKVEKAPTNKSFASTFVDPKAKAEDQTEMKPTISTEFDDFVPDDSILKIEAVLETPLNADLESPTKKEWAPKPK